MTAKVRLNLPTSLWTAKDSARLAQNTLAAIKLRTTRGVDANGQTNSSLLNQPHLCSISREQGLKPKGGRVSSAQVAQSIMRVVIVSTRVRAESTLWARAPWLTSPSAARSSITSWCFKPQIASLSLASLRRSEAMGTRSTLSVSSLVYLPEMSMC